MRSDMRDVGLNIVLVKVFKLKIERKKVADSGAAPADIGRFKLFDRPFVEQIDIADSRPVESFDQVLRRQFLLEIFAAEIQLP